MTILFDNRLSDPDDILTEDQIHAMKRMNTYRALEKCNWQIYGPGGAANMIGIKPTTLIARMKKLGFKKTFNRT